MTREHETTWRWQVPEQFNIGVACTDAHLGTPVAAQTAMIVEDDRAGTSSATFAELADASSRFAQLLRDLGVGGAFLFGRRLQRREIGLVSGRNGNGGREFLGVHGASSGKVRRILRTPRNGCQGDGNRSRSTVSTSFSRSGLQIWALAPRASPFRRVSS